MATEPPRSRIARVGLVLGLLALAASTVLAQEAAETIVKHGPPVEGDLYLAGRTVEIATDVRGDLVVAGQYVGVNRAVAEDLIVAGETITIAGPVADDVRAAGRLISITAAVADHVVAAGQQVTLAADASTGSWAWLAGRLVQVLGSVGGELSAAGQEVVIGGAVAGDVTVYAERVRVLETARIRGRFTYASDRPLEIADGAVIEGEIERVAMPGGDDEAAAGAALGGVLVFLSGLLVVGLVYLALFPGVSRSADDIVARHPWRSVGWGLAVLLLMPPIAFALMATVIGLPLGLALLASYCVILLFGFVNGVSWLGGLVTARPTGPSARHSRGFVMFAVTLAVLALLQLIPLFGQLVWLGVWIVGIGGLLLALSRNCRSDLPAIAGAEAADGQTPAEDR